VVGQPAHIAAEEAQPGLKSQLMSTQSTEDSLQHAQNIKIIEYSGKYVEALWSDPEFAEYLLLEPEEA
jgi:hypothetical protein